MADRDFSFTQDRDQARAVQEYLNPLPRSISRRGEYALLDGEWNFELDPDDRGMDEQWYRQHSYRTRAIWPGAIEGQLAAAQDTQRQVSPWQDRLVAWYEREFQIPEPWCSPEACLVQVTFGACGYETRVWLNGHPLQTVDGHSIHYGGYTSFSYEFPPELLQPSNRLTVRIAHSMDAEIPRGKQESRVYQRGGIWYQTISGPVRSIWLEPVERNRLRSRLGIISQIESRSIEFHLISRIHDPGSYRVRLVVSPRGTAHPLQIAEYELPLKAGEKPQRLPLLLPDAALWSPQHPDLYHLVAQLISPNGVVSQIETHFGLRKIETRDGMIYLNNQAIYLDGILYQPATATFETMRRHMLAMKALGCNLVRVHIAGIDPRIYDLADEMGMLLWIEVPSPHYSSPRSRANHWDELQRMLSIIGTHPSVILWSLYNEDWGIQDVMTNPEPREYIASAYDYMKLNVPQLLVVDNDGWHHISVEGRLKSDLLTAHIYTPNLNHWQQQLDRLVDGDLDHVAVEPLAIGDPFFYRSQLPLAVSEWGGFGFSMYGGPEESAARAARIRAFKHELRARPISGDIYTQATSIEDETNGLIDPETGELLVPAGILDTSNFTPPHPG